VEYEVPDLDAHVGHTQVVFHRGSAKQIASQSLVSYRATN
jgi:hypothetical protein